VNSVVCTLFEGDYHYGVGALANSLYAHGFRGTIYAGYRGMLPLWITHAKKCDGFTEFSPAEGLTLRFIPLTTKIHFANYKPKFLLQVWEQYSPAAKSLFYFDPDITISRHWTFFEEWVEAGVAVCHNMGAWCPYNHPIRYVWRKFMEKENLICKKELDEYFNSGFLGVGASDRGFIETWAEIIKKISSANLIDASKLSTKLPLGSGINAFHANDQDALNIAAMLSEISISSIGEEAMGFAYGGIGNLMLHALGSPKPWAKNYTKLGLKGRAPNWADKAYWNFTRTPISLYSPMNRLLRKSDLICGKILGRYL
jgi:hypothetical protein